MTLYRMHGDRGIPGCESGKDPNAIRIPAMRTEQCAF